MNKTLILAEKPSQAMDLARGLGHFERRDGYLENSKYIITWAYGHLLEVDTEKIAGGFRNYPVFPEKFRYRMIKGGSKQFRIIKDLLKKVDTVVEAGDPGREGELISRLILEHANFRGKILRFWVSEALTPEVVKKGFSTLRDGAEFDSLYQSALARQHADWLVGINLSRAFTLTVNNREVWSIGRVQTPVLSMLVKREKEIREFRPEEYYIVEAYFNRGYRGKLITAREKGNEVNKEDDRAFRLKKEEAEKIAKEVSGQKGIITEVKRKRVREKPPLLHSLTSLQREANEIYGFKAQETLNIAQSLYEKKLITYPRTESQYLGETEDTKRLASRVLESLGKDSLIPRVWKVGKRVFDSSKLTDHHAIIPMPTTPDKLREKEDKVYRLIRRRFIGAFMDDYLYESITVITKVKNHFFFTRGKSNLFLGWRELYPGAKEDNLPFLREGARVVVENARAIQKFTQPPPRYTESSILKAMEKAHTFVNDENLKKVLRENSGIGTPATRAGIIETLIRRGYVARKRKKLIPTKKGFYLAGKVQEKEIASPEMTAFWEQKLEDIRERKNTYFSFIAEIKEFTEKAIRELKRER